MGGLALRLAAALRRGRYAAEPSLEAEVPAVWFEPAQRVRAEQLLEKARAGISVTGTLRKGHTAEPIAQQYVQWVVEMPTPEEASALVQCVGSGARADSRFTIGVARGRLFSLIVAGSIMQGVAAFESPETLRPIANETSVLLEAALSGRP